MLGQYGASSAGVAEDCCQECSSLGVVLTAGTVAPEVPGVCQELPPGLRVLGGPQVARGDLLSCRDGEPRPDLDQALLWVVLTDRVTPRNTTIA